jgi:hypothetical protein
MPSGSVLVAAALVISTMTACASHLPDVPGNVATGSASSLPAPKAEPNGAAPRIIAMQFSSLDVGRPSRWSGTIVTGTNVARVEVRTNLFSVDVPRTAFGRFHFAMNILDTPPIFVRAYRLRVIARNSAGAEYEEDLPFRLR